MVCPFFSLGVGESHCVGSKFKYEEIFVVICLLN